jgi:hypothetical protein
MSAEVLERSYSFEHPEKRLPNNQPILCFHKFPFQRVNWLVSTFLIGTQNPANKVNEDTSNKARPKRLIRLPSIPGLGAEFLIRNIRSANPAILATSGQ